jgi:DNA-binding MarR family transcriptional regulator
MYLYSSAMPERTGDTVVRVWVRLNKAQRHAFTAIEHALKSAGLPPLAWYDVLLEVERAGPAGLRPFELERALLLAQYNLSRLLGRIEQAGYIERHAHREDGRGQVVRITGTGKTMRRRMWPVYAAAIERSLGEHLSERQAGQLDTLLGELIAQERRS